MHRFVYGYTQEFVDDYLWPRLQHDMQFGRRFKKEHLLELLRIYKQNPDYREIRTRCGGSTAQSIADFEVALHDFLLAHPYIPQSLRRLPREGGGGPFRNVIGHVDVSPIKLCRPTIDQSFYYQSKYKSHCLKVQAVVDLRGRIVHLSMPWIGARHGLYIYRKSVETRQLKVPASMRLLADLGYASNDNVQLRLITPHERPPARPVLNAAENAFNRRHASMRSVVERAFGFLK
ncbi:hypothetical protein FOZ63_006902, partial [Perkinsus olseni]